MLKNFKKNVFQSTKNFKNNLIKGTNKHLFDKNFMIKKLKFTTESTIPKAKNGIVKHYIVPMTILGIGAITTAIIYIPIYKKVEEQQVRN